MSKEKIALRTLLVFGILNGANHAELCVKFDLHPDTLDRHLKYIAKAVWAFKKAR